MTAATAPLHVIEAASDAAWERYVEASGRANRVPGHQADIFNTAVDEAREWHGIWKACELARAEAVIHG